MNLCNSLIVRALGAPKVIKCNEIRGFITRFKVPEHGILWFNIKDLRALAFLADILHLHSVALAQFYDLRYYHFFKFTFMSIAEVIHP